MMRKVNECLFRVAMRPALLSVAASLAIAGCSTGGARVATASATDDAPPQPYMRVVRSDSGAVQLEIAMRELRPIKRSGPAIWLVAVSHVGETNYFATVQSHLDSKALVLFEGVGERHARASAESSAASHFSNNKLMKGDADSTQSSLQATLARSLGLAFQLDAIDYDRPHFRNSDLTVSQIQALLNEDLPSAQPRDDSPAADSDDELSQLVGLMDGSSMLGIIVHMGVKLIGSSPKLQALTKVAVIEMFGNLEGDISQAAGLPPGMKNLIDVLIQGRNQVVLRDLKAELPKLRQRDSTAVFYGAGHMHDLESRIRHELNYRPANQLWLTAISVDPGQAGITAAEVRMIQTMVKWQLDALQPKKPAAAN